MLASTSRAFFTRPPLKLTSSVQHSLVHSRRPSIWCVWYHRLLFLLLQRSYARLSSFAYLPLLRVCRKLQCPNLHCMCVYHSLCLYRLYTSVALSAPRRDDECLDMRACLFVILHMLIRPVCVYPRPVAYYTVNSPYPARLRSLIFILTLTLVSLQVCSILLRVLRSQPYALRKLVTLILSPLPPPRPLSSPALRYP